jgi:bifunctional non-homologous end joining protein LigD
MFIDAITGKLPGRRRAQPAWLGPMLATLVAEPFSRDGWIFEPKLDGIRCLIFREGNRVELLSRNRKKLNDAYPELIAPMVKQNPASFIADGEIVAFENRVTSFAQLQKRMQVRDPREARRRGVEVFYYVFDLLYLSGHDLRSLPLLRRKELLKENFQFRDPIRYTEHREGDGEAFFREACRNGLEGLIAKRADSEYVSERSRDWLKFKCSAEQEFVIIGYTDPKGARAGFGALVVGYYDSGHLVSAGKVGTGFDTQTLTDLTRKMERLKTADVPSGSDGNRNVHWIKPQLVAQVAFTEWTRDGKLRHPRFLGLRDDKPAAKIVRERTK